MIYHITTPDRWQSALTKGIFETASLQIEAFIHCCSKEQIQSVITRYYSHLQHLVVLEINESKITSLIQLELSPMVNQMFPHIYGHINLDAVENIHSLRN